MLRRLLFVCGQGKQPWVFPEADNPVCPFLGRYCRGNSMRPDQCVSSCKDSPFKYKGKKYSIGYHPMANILKKVRVFLRWRSAVSNIQILNEYSLII